LPDYLANLSLPGAVLIPDSDDWTEAIARLPERLKDRFPSSTPSLLAVETMIDKWQFAELLARVDVPRPKTMLLTSEDQMSALPETCYENMFLKPLNSQEFWQRHRVKALRLRGRQHALDLMAELQRHGRREFPILLQEYVPGPATKYYLVDGFVDRHGRTRALIARRRIRMYPPGFGSSSFSETIPIDDVQHAVETLEQLWAEVGFRGIFDAEFKYDDRDGQFKILEVNARPWWYVEFATRCGVDLCRMAYDDALRRPVEPVTTYPTGRRCMHLLFDLVAHHGSAPGLRGFVQWVRSLKNAEDILYCWDDPKPCVAAILAAGMKQWRRRNVPRWVNHEGEISRPVLRPYS
jgi:predicted ATP-grasp superfamily ATP-dependent carboligase